MKKEIHSKPQKNKDVSGYQTKERRRIKKYRRLVSYTGIKQKRPTNCPLLINSHLDKGFSQPDQKETPLLFATLSKTHPLRLFSCFRVEGQSPTTIDMSVWPWWSKIQESFMNWQLQAYAKESDLIQQQQVYAGAVEDQRDCESL